ncbi:hypothetical protein BH09ACT8_BH09ACT8_48690 [soil metagenome]
MSRLGRRVPAAMGLALIAAVILGCSETVTGTPQADPAQTGVPLSPDTTTSRPSRTSGPPPSTTATSSTPVPTRTTSPDGAAPAATATCADYDGMDNAARRALMVQIGKDNAMIGEDPETWAQIADMLCSIAKPSALVSDVVMGKM